MDKNLEQLYHVDINGKKESKTQEWNGDLSYSTHINIRNYYYCGWTFSLLPRKIKILPCKIFSEPYFPV